MSFALGWLVAKGIEIIGAEAGHSHFCRAMLNTVTAALGVAEEIRSAKFGHYAETNRAGYFDHTYDLCD